MIVYIKTHGRPDKQLTYHTLREAGYTGDIVLVIDNEDEYGHEYLRFVQSDDRLWLHVFDKKHLVEEIDSGVYNPKRDVNLYAWVACERFAKYDKQRFYIMADDDITGFRWRYEEDGHLRSLKITQNLDIIFKEVFQYMFDAQITAMSTGIPQMYFSGDITKDLWKWRVPYTFVFRYGTYPMNWVSEYEEDIITAIQSSNNGQYLSVLPIIQRETIEIGTNYGGMHNSYTDSFKNAQYGYIWYPSCREIIPYKDKFMCKIKRDNAFAKLVSSSYCIHK